MFPYGTGLTKSSCELRPATFGMHLLMSKAWQVAVEITDVCVCVCVCVVCTHVSRHVCAYMHACACMRACVRACVCVCVCACVRACVHVRVRAMSASELLQRVNTKDYCTYSLCKHLLSAIFALKSAVAEKNASTTRCKASYKPTSSQSTNGALEAD